MKNHSLTINADVVVPKVRERHDHRAGRAFGGWSLYVKDGVPAYDYNFLGHAACDGLRDEAFATGKATIRFDFAYDGGGPARAALGRSSSMARRSREGRSSTRSR